MGQFGNQPDFGTQAQTVTPTTDPSDALAAINFPPSALYIGTGGTLVCRVVGQNAVEVEAGNPQTGITIFNNIPNGTFFPVMVTTVWSSDGGDIDTTCAGIIALR